MAFATKSNFVSTCQLHIGIIFLHHHFCRIKVCGLAYCISLTLMHIDICNISQTDIIYGMICSAFYSLSFILVNWPVLTFLLIYQGVVQNVLAWSEHLRHLNDFNELRKSGIVYIAALSEFSQIISGPLFTFFSISTIQSIAVIYRGYSFIPCKY